jgi:oleate hydratase
MVNNVSFANCMAFIFFADPRFSFALQPWHSAIEFRRSLRKHLADIQHMNNVSTMDRTQYTVYESIVLPITTYLKKEGVDFRFHAKVTDLQMNPDGDPTTVSQIVLQDEKQPIEVNEADIVMMTVGSSNSGLELGANLESPPFPSPSETAIDGAWSLWLKLSQKSHKFGDPLNFNDHVSQSRLETFTVTLRDSEFMQLYEKLTHNSPGSGALLSLADSNWLLSICVPHQPVCSNQPPNVQVIWGYGLKPEKDGNFVTKPMFQCTGEEIMTELLMHLSFPVESLLPTSNTVPCLMPLATSPLLPRAHKHRPEVIPPQTTNLALIGQFAEISDDTTFGMEYSVRGAQTAVYKLMGLSKKPPKVKTNLLLNVLDLLHM